MELVNNARKTLLGRQLVTSALKFRVIIDRNETQKVYVTTAQTSLEQHYTISGANQTIALHIKRYQLMGPVKHAHPTRFNQKLKPPVFRQYVKIIKLFQNLVNAKSVLNIKGIQMIKSVAYPPAKVETPYL